MLMDQLQEFKHDTQKPGYKGPTKYMGQDIYPWNHPTSAANIALNTVQHTYMFGIQVLAPPGHGKSTLATVIAHHIHLEKPEYDVLWAGGYEFTHQEEFFSGLSKQPHVIVFDDITGVLKQMSEKEVEANFEALTKVRWHLDPATGKIPVIIITTSHYSKNLEKEIRAQLGMTIFCGFGMEEQSNIDTFVKKGTRAHATLESYGTISDKMFNAHEYHLAMPGNAKAVLQTDKPFRCACRLSYSDAQMLLFSDKDCCEKCVKKQYKKVLDPHIVFEKIKTFIPTLQSNVAWSEALKHALVKRGVSKILDPKAAAILDFIDQELLTHFTTDLEELANIFWIEHKHKPVPKKVYHKRKRTTEVLNDLEKVAIREPIEPTKLVEQDHSKFIVLDDPFSEKTPDLDIRDKIEDDEENW